jgi:hypothetical protein
MTITPTRHSSCTKNRVADRIALGDMIAHLNIRTRRQHIDKLLSIFVNDVGVVKTSRIVFS